MKEMSTPKEHTITYHYHTESWEGSHGRTSAYNNRKFNCTCGWEASGPSDGAAEEVIQLHKVEVLLASCGITFTKKETEHTYNAE